MTVAELLSHMRRLDVDVWAEGDRLRLSAPPGVLTLEMREQLMARKYEIMAFIRTAFTLAAPATTVVAVRSEGTRPPFFAVPAHNGDVFCYVHLARCLGQDQPFYALQPPGLDGARAPAETIEALAAHFVRELRAFLPGGPYLLGGFCVGGAVAFETARQLREQGEDVRLLVLLGSPHPVAFRTYNRARKLIERVGHHGRLLWRSPAQHGRHLIRTLRARAKLASGVVDPLSRYSQNVERATLAAIRVYSPRPFDGRISLVLPSEEWAKSYDRPMDWRAQSGDGFDVVTGPRDCNGDVMLREPHVRWLAGELRALLDRAQAGFDRGASLRVSG